MPKVINKRHDAIPPGAVYVGRPSKWGNPFVMHGEADRDRVVEEYRTLVDQLMEDESFRQQLEELRGKDLVCWCAPLSCHADILLEVANR